MSLIAGRGCRESQGLASCWAFPSGPDVASRRRIQPKDPGVGRQISVRERDLVGTEWISSYALERINSSAVLTARDLGADVAAQPQTCRRPDRSQPQPGQVLGSPMQTTRAQRSSHPSQESDPKPYVTSSFYRWHEPGAGSIGPVAVKPPWQVCAIPSSVAWSSSSGQRRVGRASILRSASTQSATSGVQGPGSEDSRRSAPHHARARESRSA